MRLQLTCASAILLASTSFAQRTDFTAHADVQAPKQAGQTTLPTTSTASFSGGGATCSVAVSLGSGPMAAVPFDNTAPGSTPTNPFEIICEHGGQLGIDLETWFSWTASSTGIADLNVCGQSTVDTKIAIYADDCANILTLNPLACKDDAFSCTPAALQTHVTWEATAGTSYLIQLGTFATAPGGPGAFDITEGPARPAGQWDLGTSHNATGTGGAVFDFMVGHTYDAGAGELVNSIDIAWGSIGAPPLPVGLTSTLVIYSGDETGLTYLADQTIAFSMENTDTFINYPLTVPVAVSGPWSVAVVTALDGVTNGAHFPYGWDDTVGSLDVASGLTRAWDAFEQTNPPFDIMNPLGAEFPPLRTQPGGDDYVFMIRANTSPNVASFVDLCNGDGGNQTGCTDCPCGNNAAMGTIGGCLNSANTATRLAATGDPSVSLPSGDMTDLRFGVSSAPAGAFCILNSGDNVAPQGMANPCFGLDSGAQSVTFDGLRCAVGSTLRHGGRSADGNGDVGVTNNPWGGEGGPPVGIAQQGLGFTAGQTRYFQVIHRDDPLAVCTRGLNTTQAICVTFTP